MVHGVGCLAMRSADSARKSAELPEGLVLSGENGVHLVQLAGNGFKKRHFARDNSVFHRAVHWSPQVANAMLELDAVT